MSNIISSDAGFGYKARLEVPKLLEVDKAIVLLNLSSVGVIASEVLPPKVIGVTFSQIGLQLSSKKSMLTW